MSEYGKMLGIKNRAILTDNPIGKPTKALAVKVIVAITYIVQIEISRTGTFLRSDTLFRFDSVS